MNTKKMRLPYVDNAIMILLTVAVNIGVVFVFFRSGGTTLSDVMLDTAICAVITTVIGILFVYPKMKRMRDAGQIPTQVPVSTLMQKLPKNPVVLGVTYAIVFGALMIGLNVVILWFFGLTDMDFIPWLAYKLIYATLLSIKVVEFVIYRYVQPDWANAGVKPEEEYTGRPVKDPLPKISVFKEMFASVTGSIAMNMITGAVLR